MKVPLVVLVLHVADLRGLNQTANTAAANTISPDI
jgi:hypothetical protein